jgi:outer membrane immunogenic protein
MKKLMPMAAAFVAIGAAPALAADLPARTFTKAPAPIVDPTYNWSGFYAGANVGGDWIGSDHAVLTLPPGPPQAFLPFLADGTIATNYGTTGAGVIGGVQAGYNWQMQSLVLGLEADFSASSLNRAQTQNTIFPAAGVPVILVPFSTVYSTRVDYLGTVRGRLGGLVTPTLLAYATGGFAYGSVSHSFSQSSGFGLGGPTLFNESFGTVKNVDAGWTVGAGLEWALGNNFTVRGEYLYVNLRGDSFTTTSNNANCGGVNVCSFTLSPGNLGLNIVRAGINYKFGGPVVAEY